MRSLHDLTRFFVDFMFLFNFVPLFNQFNHQFILLGSELSIAVF